MVLRKQEASVLDLALPPPFHRIKGKHITSLCLNSEVAKSHVFLSTYFLLAEPQV